MLELVESGHNFCLVGKTGAGKSTVVLTNEKTVIERKKCHIVSSNRMSCESYNGAAETVHSQYGLQTYELPNRYCWSEL